MNFHIFPVLLAFTANFILGISSLYWHIFSDIPSVLLVAYRIIFSLIFLIIISLLTCKTLKIIRSLNWGTAVAHSFAALLISINWGTFIWASIHGNVLESGLGYLIAPVVVMLIGILAFNENIYRENIIAIIFIAIALMFLMFYEENLNSWVYWTIGLTWGGYTLLKKFSSLTPVDGLFIETFFLFIAVFGFGFFVNAEDYDISFNLLNANKLLYLCGLVSVTPLIMFSFVAKKLSSYSMGAMQFVLPTTQFFVSIGFYNQHISDQTYICLGAIWIALIITTFIKARRNKMFNN